MDNCLQVRVIGLPLQLFQGSRGKGSMLKKSDTYSVLICMVGGSSFNSKVVKTIWLLFNT